MEKPKENRKGRREYPLRFFPKCKNLASNKAACSITQTSDQKISTVVSTVATLRPPDYTGLQRSGLERAHAMPAHIQKTKTLFERPD